MFDLVFILWMFNLVFILFYTLVKVFGRHNQLSVLMANQKKVFISQIFHLRILPKDQDCLSIQFSRTVEACWTWLNPTSTHTIYITGAAFDRHVTTGWRRLIGSPNLQIIFHQRATKYRSLLRKMTYTDKGSYESSPPCNLSLTPWNLFLTHTIYITGAGHDRQNALAFSIRVLDLCAHIPA